MVDFLFALIELFSLSIMVPELWREMCTARLFSQGVDLFALKFYLDRVVPINHSWQSHWLTASLCVPSFWHNTVECEGRTGRQEDGRTDML